MLCTFTINQDQNDAKIREVVIQSADIKSIEDDHTGHTVLTWLAGDALQFINIQGTARENLERLQMEEFTNLERAHQVQKRIEGGYPAFPVERGKGGQK
jgi:hypothetical protein